MVHRTGAHPDSFGLYEGAIDPSLQASCWNSQKKNFAFIPSHMWAIDSDDSGSEDEDKHSTFSTNASKFFDAKD